MNDLFPRGSRGRLSHGCPQMDELLEHERGTFFPMGSRLVDATMLARPLDQHRTRAPLAKSEVLGACYQYDSYSDPDVVLHSDLDAVLDAFCREELRAAQALLLVHLRSALLSEQLTRHRWTRTHGPSSAPPGSAGEGEEECKRPG